jgi:hypothetical protein
MDKNIHFLWTFILIILLFGDNIWLHYEISSFLDLEGLECGLFALVILQLGILQSTQCLDQEDHNPVIVQVSRCDLLRMGIKVQ